MKILFVTDLYPVKKGEKTTARTLHNFVIEWIKSGHTVQVVKPNFLFNTFLRNKPIYSTGFYDYDGVSVYNVNYHLPFLNDVGEKISKKIDPEDFDIIIAHMPSGIIFANNLNKKFNKPLICAVHSSDLKVLSEPLYKNYFRKNLIEAYKNSKKIACRSIVLQEKFAKIFPEFASKTFVAQSGVPSDYIYDREPVFSSPVKVLTCANFIKRKNIDKIILAIKDLNGFELNIIGDGKEYRNLKKLAKNCKDKIKFLGRLSVSDTLFEMRKSDIFILPSVDETFGMVYLEAMASGCITVCSENDGVSGFIKDSENGFLCEPSVEGVKEVLLKIKNWHDEGAKKARFFGAPTLFKIQENAYRSIKKSTSAICANDYLNNLK